VHTYGMVTGMINCGLALGAIVGPIGGGAAIQSVGYPWTMTIIGFAQLFIVSKNNYLSIIVQYYFL